MKKLIFLWLLLLSVAGAAAQTEGVAVQRAPQGAVPAELTDSVAADSCAEVPFCPFGMGWNGWNGYGCNVFPLHEGFNAQVSMSATVGLGGRHPSGVGFGRDLNLAYASPLNRRLTYAVAANTSQFNWGSFHYNQAGVGGALNYAANDKVSFSVEGYKNLVRPRSFLPFDGTRCDSYVGGALNVKWSDNVFIQVSVGTSTWR